MMAKASETLEVDGHTLALSNLGKVFYPETGLTKGEVIAYYATIAPVLLPHLRQRAVTLKRYPNGVAESFFYEKQAPSHRPSWVKTTAVWSEGRGDEIDYCLLDSRAALIWVANLAAIELHPFLHRAGEILRPDGIMFDLDPGEGTSIVECSRVALVLRAVFAQLGLAALPKTSGSKGLQLYVPLLARNVTYEKTKTFAQRVAQRLEEAWPEMVLARMARGLRRGKIFLDWSQNDEHKTTVAVYALRAKSRPTVSTPVTWDEVDACAKKGDPTRLAFLASAVLRRVEKHGDLFAGAQTLRQKLPSLQALENLASAHFRPVKKAGKNCADQKDWAAQ